MKGPGGTGECDDRAKIFYWRKRPGGTGGAKTGQNILLEEGTGLNRR